MTVENRPPMPGITPPGRVRVGTERYPVRPVNPSGLQPARVQAGARHRAGLGARRADAHERAALDGARRKREAVRPAALAASAEALDDARADRRLDRHARRPPRLAVSRVTTERWPSTGCRSAADFS